MAQKDDLNKLYNALITKGYSTEDLGDENIFRSKMKDKNNRKQLYDYVSGRGDFRIGDYDSYENRISNVYSITELPSPEMEGSTSKAGPKAQEVVEYDSFKRMNAQNRMQELMRKQDNEPKPRKTLQDIVSESSTPVEQNILNREPISREPAYTKGEERNYRPDIFERIKYDSSIRDEDAAVDKEYTPKVEEKEEDVFENYRNRFGLTQRGAELQEELAQIQSDLQNKYSKEFENTPEYKAIVGKKYNTQEEIDAANKALNDAYNKKYGAVINKEMEPYLKAYEGEIFQRYAPRIQEGLRTVAKNDTSKEVKALTGEVDELLEKQHKILRSKGPSSGNAMSALMGSRAYNQSTAKERQELGALEASQRLLEQSQEIIEEAGKKGNTNFFAGLGRGFRDNMDIENFTFGLSEMADSKYLNRALEKAEKGEKLTPAEEKLLEASVVNMATYGYFSSDLGRGYGAGSTTAVSLPFMLEFIANPISGSGNAIAKGLLKFGLKKFGRASAQTASKGALNAFGRGIASNTGKFAGRLAGDAAAALGMEGTTGLGRVAAGTLDRLNENYDYSLDDNGQLQVRKTGNTSIGGAFARSAASTFFENQSEMVFNAFRGWSPFMKAVDKALPGRMNEFLNRIKNSKPGQLYRELKNNPTFREIVERAQFHGQGEEYLEEVYNNLANVAMGEMTMEDALDLDNNIDTFLGLAPTSVMFGLFGLGGMAADRYSNRRKMRALFEKMTPEQQAKLTELTQMSKERGNEDIKKFIEITIADKNLTTEQKKDEIEYAFELAKQNAIEDLQQEQTPEGRAADDAYVQGTELPMEQRYSAEQERVAAEEALREVDENALNTIDRMLADDASANEIEEIISGMDEDSAKLARDYYNKSMRINGIVDSARDDAEEAVASFEASLQEAIIPDAEGNGTITTATLMSGAGEVKEEVYVIANDGVQATILQKDGTKKMVNSGLLDNVQTSLANDVVQLYQDRIGEQMRDQTDMSLNHHPKTRVPQPGMQIWNGDMPLIITEVNADGSVRAFPAVLNNKTGLMEPKNGSTPVDMSVKESLDLQDDYYNKMDTASIGVNLSEKESENAIGSWDEESKVSENDSLHPTTQEEKPVSLDETNGPTSNGNQPALLGINSPVVSENKDNSVSAENQTREQENAIPTDEKGNPLYHKVPVDVTLADLMDGTLTDEEVDAFIAANQKEADSELKKITDKAPKIGTNKAKYLADKQAWQEKVSEAQAKVDYWNQVQDAIKENRNLIEKETNVNALNNEGNELSSQSDTNLNQENDESREVESLSREGNEVRREDAAESLLRSAGDRTTAGNGRSGWTKESVLGDVLQRSKENQTWIEDLESIAGKQIGQGGENEAYLSHDGKSVIKVNDFSYLPDNSTNLDDFVNRLDAHNELFPSDAITVLGFTQNSDGKISVVLSQPYISNAREATQEEIDSFLEGMDFYTDMSGNWTDGTFDIADTKPNNVLVDEEGILHFIDTLPYDSRKPGNMLVVPTVISEGTITPIEEAQIENQGKITAKPVSQLENGGKIEVKLPQSKSNTKNKKRAADIKQTRYELMDAKRELSVAQATNSGYTPEEVEEKKKRVEEAESKLKDLTNKVPDKEVSQNTDRIGKKGEQILIHQDLIKSIYVKSLADMNESLKNIKENIKNEQEKEEPNSDLLEKLNIDKSALDRKIKRTKSVINKKVSIMSEGEFMLMNIINKNPSLPFSQMSENDVLNSVDENEINDILDKYPDYIKELSDNGVLQKEFNEASIQDEINIRNAIESSGYEVEDLLDTSEKKKSQKKKGEEERIRKSEELMKKLGIYDESVRFREIKDGDITSFAQKYNLDESDVGKYAKSMNVGNLGGASYAFKNIKRSIRLLNSNLSLGEFVKVFAPVKADLYEKFGNVDALRDEYVQQEIEQRNVMEAARKRAEEEAETERKRLEEFELMTDTEMDASYFKALEENDEPRMRDIVNEAARRKGYVSADEFRMAHRAPSYDEEGYDKSMVDIANDKDNIRQSLNEQLKMNRDTYKDESASAINEALSAIDEGKHPTVTIYRAVPKSLKEGRVRNGDWVSLSESYVKTHGEHVLNGDYRIIKEEVPTENLYWDGNDINEWGYDDRSDYRYKDTKNNRKLSDLITRDDNGNIIPPSKRFNARKADTRYRLIGEQETANLDEVTKQREIIQTVEDLSDKLNTPIHIARSLNEIPDGSAKRAIEEGRKVKAWFDTGTREVFFYIPNATDVNDAKVSILHEVVGHKGLRNLFGTENETKFDSMMMDLFEKLPLNVRSEIADMAVSRYASNVSVAMDEYLAEQAEKDETPGWWDRVVSAIRDFFRKMGVDVKLSENDVKYLLWRSRKKLETGDLFEQAKDVVMRNKLGIGLNETQETSKSAPTESTRFRIVGGIFDSAGKDVEVVERETGNAREMYDRTLQTAGYKMRESWQDSMLGLKEAQDAIAKATHSRILDYENAYMAENALSSRSLAEINAYRELVYKPILEEIAQMKKQGAKYEDISDYLITKHGIERNREMAVRKALAEDEDTVKENIERWTEDKKNIWNNGSMSWKEKQEELDRIAISYGADMSVDYSGLSAMFPNDDMAETTAEAYKAVEGFEEKFETAPLLDKVKAATTATLDKQRDSGLMNKDTYKSIQDMYEFYVPLRGWEEKTADEVYDYITSETPVFNAPLKTAKGRTSKSDDPLPTIANIAESGILQGNRNLMKQKFLTMVENHRSNLVSVSELWVKYDAVNDNWIAIFPEIPNNASAEEVENIVSQFNARMEELSKNNPDEYKKASDARDIPYKILPNNLKEHQVIVKRNGKEYVLTINGNPRAAQALNGLTNPNATNNPAIKFFESTNRFLAANFTQRNPAFVISNMFRDGFYSNSVIWVKESPLYAKKYNKNWAKSLKEMGGLVKRYKTNSLDMNNDTDRMFLEFINNGGETGYTFINSVEEYKGIIAKELKKQNRSKFASGTAFDILGEAMDTFGRWAEDTSRFAAYRTSREMGRSIARSISDAKEISVNFNKKGSGAKTAGQWEKGNRLNALQAWTSQTARGLYIFWNAGVQGLTNFARLAKRNPGKFAGLASSYFVLGTMMPIINAAIASAMGGDGDEDDYYNLPEYVRRNNICIYVGGEWITMPLPIELRAIYGLGELASGLLSGKENMTGGKLTKKIAEQVSQIMPIDMMEGGGGFSAFVPSYVKPAYEVWTNKDWTGIPIYRKNDFNKNMPEWTKAYSSTSPELVKLSEIINEWTGGTKYKTGMIDFNPAIVEHLFESYLGGVGTTINQLKKTLMMPFNEDLQELRNAPVISRFMRSADSRSVQKRIDEEYFNNRNRFELIQQEVNGYKKELNNPQTNDFDYAKYQTLYNKMINSDEYRKYIEFKEMDKVLKRMRDEFKQSGNEELEAQMFLLKEAMNEVAK